MPQANNGEDQNVTWFNLVDEDPLDDTVDIESYELDTPQVTFEDSIAAIQADAMAPQDLLGFSNITRKQVHHLRSVWTSLDAELRVTIADIALMVAREQPYADFGRFFQVLLDDDAEDVRLNAANGAALSEDSALIKPLAHLAEHDSNIDVREAALQALAPHVVALDLGVVADRNDQQRLMKLKHWAVDESWPSVLRAAALQAYSHNMMDDDIGAIIESFVQDDDEILHLGAMHAMSEFGAGHFTRFLERQLQSADTDAREAAATAMGMSNDSAVVPMLTMVGRTDTEPAVREAAFVALANIASDAAMNALQQLRLNASDDDIEIIDGGIQYVLELKELENMEDFEMFEFEEEGDPHS